MRARWMDRQTCCGFLVSVGNMCTHRKHKCPGPMFNSLDQNPLSPALKSAFLKSCLRDFWHTKALGVRLQTILGNVSILEKNYFQHLAAFLTRRWYSINIFDWMNLLSQVVSIGFSCSRGPRRWRFFRSSWPRFLWCGSQNPHPDATREPQEEEARVPGGNLPLLLLSQAQVICSHARLWDAFLSLPGTSNSHRYQ